MLHALTIDVEDWPQSSLNHDLPITERSVHNTRMMLEIFRRHETHGTFFILGLLAEKFPEVVREIAADGHEIGSHGYSHKAVFQIGPDAFRDELKRSVGLLEDITGQAVRGYRAPDFSVTEESLWALDILAEEGLEYDSSIFPVRMRRYGIDDVPRHMYRLDNGLIEIPMSTVVMGGRRWPVAGGGYLRLLPWALTQRAIRRLESEQIPTIVYLHPYEVDPTELSEIEWPVPLKTRLTQGLNRRHIAGRLDRMLSQFRFGSVAEVLEESPPVPLTTLSSSVVAG
ncbi:Peptidoglycan deacetylase [Maioricimonas rarisocia]|uniref:Peptidoglycan deacetylase n=1 Tax=Maioricimonas rarisocia TaxID=2528026 RepID=A0A517Z0U6_9PLAN|nr:XrtA system polysaccharide deacetylase [Maioricimonas rarisocia]QDU36100.1 Peptidoglycan deacetylase [Maioricimonas rarisocia]